MTRRPPRSTRTDTLVPYTTLFRSNMFLLGKIADPEQIDQYLMPVIRGEKRSVFAMTEPGGAGSDPGQLSTEAVFDGENFVINGLKWLIRSEEHTSELQSLMRISYAVFCLTTKIKQHSNSDNR